MVNAKRVLTGHWGVWRRALYRLWRGASNMRLAADCDAGHGGTIGNSSCGVRALPRLRAGGMILRGIGTGIGMNHRVPAALGATLTGLA